MLYVSIISLFSFFWWCLIQLHELCSRSTSVDGGAGSALVPRGQRCIWAGWAGGAGVRCYGGAAARVRDREGTPHAAKSRGVCFVTANQESISLTILPCCKALWKGIIKNDKNKGRDLPPSLKHIVNWRKNSKSEVHSENFHAKKLGQLLLKFVFWFFLSKQVTSRIFVDEVAPLNEGNMKKVDSYIDVLLFSAHKV